MALADFLNQTVTVQRRLHANVDGDRTFTTISTARRAMIAPMSSGKRALHGQRAGELLCDVFLAGPDPGVDAGDLILAGGRTLEVLAPARDECGWGLVFTVECAERHI